MGGSTQTRSLIRLVLDAETAADLMTPNPVSIQRNATLPDAAALLTEKNVSAVPVLDDEGRPIGVWAPKSVGRHYRDITKKPHHAGTPPFPDRPHTLDPHT